MNEPNPGSDVDREAAARARFEWEMVLDVARESDRNGDRVTLTAFARAVETAVGEHVPDAEQRAAVAVAVRAALEDAP